VLPGGEQARGRTLRQPTLEQLTRHAAFGDAPGGRKRQDDLALVVVHVTVGPHDLDERNCGERCERLGPHVQLDQMLEDILILDARHRGQRLLGFREAS
jgi:hypothetical protein